MPAAWDDSPETRGVSFGMPGLTRVVKALLIANIGMFVLQFVALDVWFPNAFEFTKETFALVPERWTSGFPLVPLWQLVSYGFLHGGLEHLHRRGSDIVGAISNLARGVPAKRPQRAIRTQGQAVSLTAGQIDHVAQAGLDKRFALRDQTVAQLAGRVGTPTFDGKLGGRRR